MVSSLQNGVNLLKDLINLQTMRCHPEERATAFGSQLREHLSAQKTDTEFDSEKEQSIITAILEAELGMAWIGSMSISQILKHLRQAGAPEEILSGVEAGFHQLLKNGMLEFV